MSNIPKQIKSSWTALDKDVSFFEFCVPDVSNACIFSKTGEGGFYKPHHDNGVNGIHYSTTVFLTDPQEYQGENSAFILMVEKECSNHLQEQQ